MEASLPSPGHLDPRSGPRAHAPPLLLFIGFQSKAPEAWCANLTAEVLWFSEAEDALELLAIRPTAVVCLGDLLSPEESLEFLRRLEAAERPEPDVPIPPTVLVILAAGPELGLFRPFIDRDRLFFLSRQPPDWSHVAALMAGALDYFRQRSRARATAEASVRAEQALEQAAPIFDATSQEEAVRALIGAARRMGAAEGVKCWLYEPSTDTFEDPLAPLDGGVSAASGLTGFALRTRQVTSSADVRDDPRLDADTDLAAGVEEGRWLGVPIPSLQPGSPAGVLVLCRRRVKEPFSAEDQASLEALAAFAAATLAWLRRSSGPRDADSSRTPDEEIFRPEALEHRERGRSGPGRLLRLSPSWTRWMSFLAVVSAVLGLAWVGWARVDDVASGAAAVRISEDGRADVVALLPGPRRPWVEPGMELLFVLDGFRDPGQSLVITEVSAGLLSATRGRDLFGDLFGQQALPAEPFFVVTAPLPEPTFLDGRHRLPFYSGLQGRAEVKIRSERLLAALVPALERWIDDEE